MRGVEVINLYSFVDDDLITHQERIATMFKKLEIEHYNLLIKLAKFAPSHDPRLDVPAIDPSLSENGNAISTLLLCGLPIGFCMYGFSEDDSVLSITHLYVEPTYRNSGFGKQLVNHVVDVARQSGANSVNLGVFEGSHTARHLYESLGFSVYHSSMIKVTDHE